VLIGWVSEKNEDKVRTNFDKHLDQNELKHLENAVPFQLPSRLWHWILGQSGISTVKKSKDLTKSDKNKIIEMIMRTNLLVQGKTTYKDEFVTAGGLDVESLHLTGESKVYKGLYGIGELLNVDGVTGGFNFQAAWSTAFYAAKAIEKTFISRPH
jgi:predicted flavoprotein YhiN